MYRTDLFEQAGVTDAPTTWAEFEEACQKIAATGEIPVIVGGSDAWQLMRYLSFSPWRVTGDDLLRTIRQERTPSVIMIRRNTRSNC